MSIVNATVKLVFEALVHDNGAEKAFRERRSYDSR